MVTRREHTALPPAFPAGIKLLRPPTALIQRAAPDLSRLFSFFRICINVPAIAILQSGWISCIPTVHAQTLEIVVRSQPALGDSDRIYIAGNQAVLGNWNPRAVPLQLRSDSTWSGRFQFPPETPIEYKLTLGTWSREALDESGRAPANSTLIARRDTTIFVRVPAWKTVSMIPSHVTGNVKYHRRFHSAILGNDRDLIVWLPGDYDKHPARRYPVLYAHDGQNLFDPATAFAGVDWALDETADSLIHAGRIGPLIVVGIANTDDRMHEYTTARGREYARFLIEEVKPFVDKTYRTLPDRSHTAVMGSSLGGLISLFLAWEHPQVFSMAACLSGSWMWDKAAAFELIEGDTLPAPSIKLYIDHGSEGDEGRYAWIYRSMRDTLIGRGFVLGKTLEYNFGIGDSHHESAWARRVWRPMVFFFGK